MCLNHNKKRGEKKRYLRKEKKKKVFAGTQYARKFGKPSSSHRTVKEFSFQS